MRPDEKQNWLAVETRNADSLQNAFYVIEGFTGKLLLADFKSRTSWWSGLQDMYAGQMYVHLDSNERFGGHRGIMAVEGASGKVSWEQPVYRFYALTEQYLLAWEAVEDATAYIPLDLISGQKLPFTVYPAEAKVIITAFNLKRQQVCQVPSSYSASSLYFKDLELFLQNRLGQNAVQSVDYLETGRFFVTGFYTEQANKQLTYWVAVFSLAGELLLQEQLVTGAKGIGTDNFFILQDTLILIKNKNTLLGFGL